MAPRVFVYLAGPITGHEGDPAIERWRDEFCEHLFPGIAGVSPLRFEPARKLADDPIWGCAHSIWHKNRLDVMRCDATVAYLPASLGTRTLSVGTLVELGIAVSLNKPVVVASDDPRVTGNGVMRQAAGWIVPDLRTAASVINGLFAVYTQGETR